MTSDHEFTAKDVQELAPRTGAGMMDCKNALEEAGGDMDKARELLRTKGIAKAEKRAGRTRERGPRRQLHPPQRQGRRAASSSTARPTSWRGTDEFKQLVRDIALHIASAEPLGVDRRRHSGRPSCERERRIAEQQVAQEGSRRHIRARSSRARSRSSGKQRTLLAQPYVQGRQEDRSASSSRRLSAKLGEAIVVRRFARFQLGEGVMQA